MLPSMTGDGATIDELVLADAPGRWRELGFATDGDVVTLGAVRLRLAGEEAGRGIVGWSLRGVSSTELDGLPTNNADSAPPRAPTRHPNGTKSSPPEGPARHPNGVLGIDHVVAMTPDLERTVTALQAAGLDLRRVREEPTPAGAPRQAFFRLGAEILEVVQEPEQVVAARGGPDGRGARLWGLALLAPAIDETVAKLAPHVGDVRDAVQPGRRIATVRRSAGLAVPVALITP